MTDPAFHRYAVYFAPALGSAAWDAGSRWLGRCAQHSVVRPQAVVEGLSPSLLAALTAAPRRYGWHATLKAPFSLAAGVGYSDLRSRLQELAAGLPVVPMPELRACLLDEFLALTPMGDTSAIDRIAGACVTGLHPLAAPLTDTELQRRRKVPLSPSQDAMLVAWGYPHVFGEFRFHMSLTGGLQDCSQQQVDALLAAAQAHFQAAGPRWLDCLTLFAEPAPGADFVALEQFALAP